MFSLLKKDLKTWDIVLSSLMVSSTSSVTWKLKNNLLLKIVKHSRLLLLLKYLKTAWQHPYWKEVWWTFICKTKSSALIRTLKASSMGWHFPWMKNNFTDTKKVSSNMKSKVINNWTVALLASCSTRLTTWQGSWKSNIVTGDYSLACYPSHAWLPWSRTFSKTIRRFTYSALLTTVACLALSLLVRVEALTLTT